VVLLCGVLPFIMANGLRLGEVVEIEAQML
jgi:hypothetical protein